MAWLPAVVAARQNPADAKAATETPATRGVTFPQDRSRLWLVPESSTTATKRQIPAALSSLEAAIRRQATGDFAGSLTLLGAADLDSTPLAGYALYYTGVAQLRLSRFEEARHTFAELRARQPAGYLAEASALGEADAAEGQGDLAGAIAIDEELLKGKLAKPDEALLHAAKMALAMGDRQKAATAFVRLYYEHPLSDLASVAATELEGLKDVAPPDAPARYTLELGRAERLFGSRRYAEARAAFEALRGQASGDDRELVDLRLGECDSYLRRHRAARDELQPYLDHASRRAEALFFYLTVTRELGDENEYVRLARRLVDTFPDSTWAEETLNSLGTHYILIQEDDQADAAFRELSTKFPTGAHAERAAWKTGWWAYKHGRFQETARIFDEAAHSFPHSDYRPAYLYWAARSHEQSKDYGLAVAGYEAIEADYLNSYYGRLATRRLEGLPDRPASLDPPSSATPVPLGDPPPTEEQIRLLLSLGLDDQAMDELVYAERMWGDSPLLQATMAWVYNKRGDLRRGITAMKRAYPSYLAAGGEKLPPEILKILFPLDYWDLIRRYAAPHKLDPYLLAALIAQESSFSADAVSSAKAVGLMQLMTSTGRRYARALRMRYRPSILTRAETNIRLGIAYFSELVKRFGGVHFALASYNAGEHRVALWMAERPGLERDEFIDDIPFPETQNYVKKVLGTAEDYRRVYGGGSIGPGEAKTRKARASATKTPPTKKAATTKKPGAARNK